ncbi:hypothetical protein GMRT_11959 [Giardia muris]|uniref:RING-type domain-containing protein n=1 Tax=Giardia muris TaxID=5742 RepID=A0A4Z1STG3_GIAMU|nr:hypothetical protein GMRT_11959 [Giardia muris]|eukprot:TNJ29216.1 hypothetical protein GMRT_11959 [Giardia muris]
MASSFVEITFDQIFRLYEPLFHSYGFFTRAVQGLYQRIYQCFDFPALDTIEDSLRLKSALVQLAYAAEEDPAFAVTAFLPINKLGDLPRIHPIGLTILPRSYEDEPTFDHGEVSDIEWHVRCKCCLQLREQACQLVPCKCTLCRPCLENLIRQSKSPHCPLCSNRSPITLAVPDQATVCAFAPFKFACFFSPENCKEVPELAFLTKYALGERNGRMFSSGILQAPSTRSGSIVPTSAESVQSFIVSNSSLAGWDCPQHQPRRDRAYRRLAQTVRKVRDALSHADLFTCTFVGTYSGVLEHLRVCPCHKKYRLLFAKKPLFGIRDSVSYDNESGTGPMADLNSLIPKTLDSADRLSRIAGFNATSYANIVGSALRGIIDDCQGGTMELPLPLSSFTNEQLKCSPNASQIVRSESTSPSRVSGQGDHKDFTLTSTITRQPCVSVDLPSIDEACDYQNTITSDVESSNPSQYPKLFTATDAPPDPSRISLGYDINHPPLKTQNESMEIVVPGEFSLSAKPRKPSTRPSTYQPLDQRFNLKPSSMTNSPIRFPPNAALGAPVEYSDHSAGAFHGHLHGGLNILHNIGLNQSPVLDTSAPDLDESDRQGITQQKNTELVQLRTLLTENRPSSRQATPQSSTCLPDLALHDMLASSIRQSQLLSRSQVYMEPQASLQESQVSNASSIHSLVPGMKLCRSELLAPNGSLLRSGIDVHGSTVLGAAPIGMNLSQISEPAKELTRLRALLQKQSDYSAVKRQVLELEDSLVRKDRECDELRSLLNDARAYGEEMARLLYQRDMEIDNMKEVLVAHEIDVERRIQEALHAKQKELDSYRHLVVISSRKSDVAELLEERTREVTALKALLHKQRAPLHG